MRVLIAGLLLLFVGCKAVYFDKPMPVDANVMSVIPAEFDGRFIVTKHDEHSVSGTIQRVERISDTKVEVYQQKFTLLDSVLLSAIGVSKVDTAWYDDGTFFVQSPERTYRYTLHDTLSAKREKLEISIDLLGDFHYDKGDTLKCELREHDGVYYLNAKQRSGHYEVICIDLEDKVRIKNFFYARRDSLYPTAMMFDKYGLVEQEYKYDKYTRKYYLAQLNDEKFFEWIEEKPFVYGWVWEPEESPSNMWSLLVVLGIGVFLFVLIKKWRARASDFTEELLG